MQKKFIFNMQTFLAFTIDFFCNTITQYKKKKIFSQLLLSHLLAYFLLKHYSTITQIKHNS